MGNNYLLGYKGILNRYTVKRNLRSWTSRLIALLSIGVCVYLFFYKETNQIADLLNKVVDVLLSSLPDLLGFCIGGYAILVAMNNLEKMTGYPATFGHATVYVRYTAGIRSFKNAGLYTYGSTTYGGKFDINNWVDNKAINESVCKIVNLAVLSVLIWAGVLVIIMIMGTVANIFNTSIILQAVAKVTNETEEKRLKEVQNKDTDIIAEEIDYEIKTWFGTYTVKKIIKK